ncbi:uncharacterized protein G2W53_025084 [Senna tora]|uniref:Uncharacterized protein n=1 Tax=Senna tora TaxID=362788 RepID=A0A834TLJ2_9FABA|nr:uncharacterized protein G2W53_025084 [Senna tora]
MGNCEWKYVKSFVRTSTRQNPNFR